MKRYFQIFILFFQHTLQYRARMFLWFLNAFINPLVLLLFWRGILKGNQSIFGWTEGTIQTYYVLLIAAQASLLHHAEYLVAYEDIKQGNLTRELLKPFSYTKLRLISETPWRLVQGSYAILSIGIIAQLLHIPIFTSQDTSILLLASFIAVCAYFISFLFKMILGFCAFWMTSIEGLLETSEVLFFVFSGLVVPINIFPSWLQSITHATPFPYILYYPITSFIGMYTPHELINIIFFQLVWIGVLSIVYFFLWQFGVKKFEGIGQ